MRLTYRGLWTCFAEIIRAGFTDDIGVLPEDLNLAVSLFFVTFVLFQPLSAAVGRWLGPRHWIPIMMVRDPGIP